MSKRSPFREYLEALIIAGIFLGFTNTFVVKTFFIPSASMEESLLIGDHLFRESLYLRRVKATRGRKIPSFRCDKWSAATS